MKTKLIYAMVLFLITILSCSKDDDKQDEPCYLKSVWVSDNCDCTYQDFNCGMLYFISEEEYNRLLSILNTSTEPCIYIYSNDGMKDFEGYLIELQKSPCPTFGPII